MSAQVQSKPKSSFELKCIPKINKSHFIATFVDTQRLHAKLYAEEGRALWNTLNVEHSLDGSQRNRPTKEAIATGFSTPVLVPRNLKVNSIEECRTQAPGKKSKSKRPAKPNRKLEESNPIDKKTKKRTGQHSDDDEVAARLAERRNRKRAKREIARPVVNEDLRGQTEASAKKASDRKITPGLALMHGFTATNLGKNRLTVPPAALGVFRKGRASARTQITKEHAKVVKEPAFLESVFLGESPVKKSKSVHSSSESSSELGSESNIELAPSTPEKTEVLTTKVRQTSTSSTAPSTLSVDKRDQSLPARTKSEVWDIEREGYFLPSRLSPILTEPRPKSIVVNTQSLDWGKVQTWVTKQSEASLIKHDVEQTSQLSSSLAPSQSASQGGLAGHGAFEQRASKYFMQQPEDAQPETEMPSISTSIEAQLTDPTPYSLGCSAYPGQPSLGTQCFPMGSPSDQPTSLNQPYMSCCCDSQPDLDPVAVPNLVELNDIEALQSKLSDHWQHFSREVTPDDLSLGVIYPDDFYIPPRVDAPLLLNENCSEEDLISLNSFVDDGCGFMADWNPDCSENQLLILEAYSEEEHGQDGDDLSLHEHEWQHESVDGGDITSLPMGLEEISEERWIEPLAAIHSDDESMSSVVDEDSVIEALPSFLQGREILLGIKESKQVTRTRESHASSAEAEVARNLKGHWLPQRL